MNSHHFSLQRHRFSWRRGSRAGLPQTRQETLYAQEYAWQLLGMKGETYLCFGHAHGDRANRFPGGGFMNIDTVALAQPISPWTSLACHESTFTDPGSPGGPPFWRYPAYK
jgi:hypothetical protein